MIKYKFENVYNHEKKELEDIEFEDRWGFFTTYVVFVFVVSCPFWGLCYVIKRTASLFKIGCERLRSVNQVVTYFVCGVCKEEGRHLDR